MKKIALKYGAESFGFEFDENLWTVLANDEAFSAPLADWRLNEIFDAPIDSPPLEDIVNTGENVLFVVPDATRQVGAGQVLNLLVRRLIAGGVLPSDIAVVIAAGIHRAATDAEKREILTPFIFQRIKTLDHHARDLMRLTDFGETSDGIPVRLNSLLREYRHIVLIGGVTFHYFAGFTGGRKLICPGLAASQTVSATHKLAFDFETMTRRKGVGAGILDGNAVHEAFLDAARKVKISFAVNTITDSSGAITDIFCGDWQTSHRAACSFYKEKFAVQIAEKRDLTIVAGGLPQDLNLIQAHKMLDAAAQATRRGGKIIWLAECVEGVGRDDFLEWFAARNSAELAENLREKYRVNGQTAWSLMKKTEDFDVTLVTSLPPDVTAQIRVKTAPNLSAAVSEISPAAKGYILPFGAKYLPISTAEN